MVFAGSNVLDSGKDHFAVRALDTGRLLVNSLGLERATWCSNTTGRVLLGVVGMASNSRPAVIRHDELKKF